MPAGPQHVIVHNTSYTLSTCTPGPNICKLAIAYCSPGHTNGRERVDERHHLASKSHLGLSEICTHFFPFLCGSFRKSKRREAVAMLHDWRTSMGGLLRLLLRCWWPVCVNHVADHVDHIFISQTLTFALLVMHESLKVPEKERERVRITQVRCRANTSPCSCSKCGPWHGQGTWVSCIWQM